MYTKIVIYIHCLKSVHTYSIHPFIYTDVNGMYSFLFIIYLVRLYPLYLIDLVRLRVLYPHTTIFTPTPKTLHTAYGGQLSNRPFQNFWLFKTTFIL